MKEQLGLYVHIPFCVSKCRYCDFLSFSGGQALFKPYKDAVIREIRSAEGLEGRQISSIFIGGGTPTVLAPGDLAEIFGALKEFSLSPGAEVTVEANPGTLNKEILEILKASGVNRLSIGLQAAQDRLLKRMGRIHSFEDFMINYEDARRLGFQNISIDLMFGIPDQTITDWEQTLALTAALGPEHISAYSLIVEEGTAFYEEERNGTLSLPDEDTERAMYWHCREYLEKTGYRQYELSNFSKPDFFSRHNVLYWERGAYQGFGLAAHSFLGNRRFSNTANLEKYMSCAGISPVIEDIQEISHKDAMSEFMFLGLRLTEGVSGADFQEAFGQDIFEIFGNAIKDNIRKGLLLNDGSRLKLSQKGMDLANRVMADFLSI